ncbi:MAG: hypothetical protein HOV87_28525 [Catenulispora sp.]|nr:hypothetical protein [Catenulispora sp.]
MRIQDYTAISSAAVAVSAAVYAAYQARIQHRREDFELARSLHADLTTGAAAEARDLLGTVVFTESPPKGKAAADIRGAYFTLLWCFERIEGGRRSLADRRQSKTNPAVKFLDDLIGWHVDFWRDDFGKVRDWLAQQPDGPVSDSASRAAFDRLCSVFPTSGSGPGV